MAEYINTPGAALHNAGLMHTLQRHRDILQVRLIGLLLILSSIGTPFYHINNKYCLTYFHIQNVLFLCQHHVNVDFHYTIYCPLGLHARVPQNQK